ncbi:MAG: iron ABC transporter permease [Treponemataceae bacterium]|nr:iron ABC transporter permease [Treponemataceae bacterium]
MKNKNNGKFIIFLLIEIVLLIACFVLSLCLGSQNIFKMENKALAKSIFLQLRLSRSILVLLSGMLLAGSGCIFQGFFRNPLAESGVMGITAGATLGAVLSFLFPFSLAFLRLSLMSFFAFLGALLSGLLVFIFTQKNRSFSSSSAMILVGTALGTFFSAITSIILIARQSALHSVYAWILGSFSGRGWDEVKFILIPALVCFVLFFFCSRFLDVLSTGEKSAQSLGLNFNRARILVLLSGSIATACSVCSGGTIGFIGLICPHIMRRLYGVSNRHLMLLSTLFGGILLLLSDTLARLVIAPSELPVGVITSLIGVPIFIWILLGKNSRGNL